MSEHDKDKDNEKPEVKIVFTEGCFDDFEGTQEEVDALVAAIRETFEGKTRDEIIMISKPIDDLDDKSLDELMEELDFSPLEELFDSKTLEQLTDKAIEANETYGFDDEGFIKYPFTGNTRH